MSSRVGLDPLARGIGKEKMLMCCKLCFKYRKPPIAKRSSCVILPRHWDAMGNGGVAELTSTPSLHQLSARGSSHDGASKTKHWKDIHNRSGGCCILC